MSRCVPYARPAVNRPGSFNKAPLGLSRCSLAEASLDERDRFSVTRAMTVEKPLLLTTGSEAI